LIVEGLENPVSTPPKPDQAYMELALAEAKAAFAEDEVPVGAVVVCGDQVVGRGRNAKEKERDPTAHAELLAIREAARALGRWRLTGCTLFVTLEPCPMCVGAMLSARIDRLVFGCSDPKAGAAVSLVRLADDPRFNHRLVVEGGQRAEEARELLQAFFRKRRAVGAEP
jgi:tRNA(adenine34) deaminase